MKLASGAVPGGKPREGPARVGGGRSARFALAAIVAAAAGLRFAGLGGQSFWLDEAFTRLLVEKDLGGMLGGIPDSESTPPLYYVLAWAWAQVFGTGEAGLRSLSALLGTATVPVAYLAGRQLVSRAAGLVLATLVAVNPFMVWYSQEARSYALVILVTAASLHLAARAAERGERRWLAAWAAAGAAAIATHYFAALLIAAEAVWLLLRAGRAQSGAGATRAAVAAVAAAALALVSLAFAQRDNQGASGFDEAPLGDRLADIPKEFLLGEYGGPVRGLGPLCAALAGLALLLLALRATSSERRRALVPAALGACALGAGLAAALAGADYLTARHLAPVWIPLFLAAAAGMAATRARPAGLALAAALAAAFAAVTLSVPAKPELQRDDWRGAAESIGAPGGPRVILMSPATGFVPLSLYEPGTEALPGERFAVTEIAVIAMTRSDGQRLPPNPPAPGFRPLRTHATATYAAARYTADRPLEVTRAQLEAYRLTAEATGVVYQP